MKIEKVGVVGCGLMGHGIVQVAAQGGCQVVALETAPEYLEKGLARVDKSLAKLAAKGVEKGKMTQEQADAWVTETRGRITGSTDRADLADCDLVVEAIVENHPDDAEALALLGGVYGNQITGMWSGIRLGRESSAPPRPR